MNKYVLLLFAFLFSTSTGLLAQATLSIQGTVKNSDGTAVANGKYSIKFSLYTTESGGTPVWTETQDAVPITGGVYSALLGASTPLNAAFDRTYYLGVAVDGGAEWIPRARLTSSPYALSLVGSSNVFPSSGAIGAGTITPDPNTQLTVSGGTGDGKLLITAPGDKSANLWIRSGDKLGGISQIGDGTLTVAAPGAINISGGRVHLYEAGGLKAYTDTDGFVVNGRMWATGNLGAAGNLGVNGNLDGGGRVYTGNGDITSGANTDLKLYRASDLHMVCRGDGWTEFKKGIYIPGGKPSYYFGYAVDKLDWGYLYGHPNGGSSFKAHGAGLVIDLSILTDKHIAGGGFILKSDVRVKKDLAVSNGSRDLATLLQLEVTDYRKVDTLAHGNMLEKGFIAQQVEKVFPQAVTLTQGNLPDIYAQPVGLQVSGEEATFEMEKPHALVVGDRVNIITEQSAQGEYEVVKVTSNTSFTVTGWKSESPSGKAFVFGKVVNDFRRVDYDRIHTLNVSATQELARQVEALRKENAALKSNVDSLKAENSALKTAEARLDARLQAIEAKLPNH